MLRGPQRRVRNRTSSRRLQGAPSLSVGAVVFQKVSPQWSAQPRLWQGVLIAALGHIRAWVIRLLSANGNESLVSSTLITTELAAAAPKPLAVGGRPPSLLRSPQQIYLAAYRLHITLQQHWHGTLTVATVAITTVYHALRTPALSARGRWYLNRVFEGTLRVRDILAVGRALDANALRCFLASCVVALPMLEQQRLACDRTASSMVESLFSRLLLGDRPAVLLPLLRDPLTSPSVLQSVGPSGVAELLLPRCDLAVADGSQWRAAAEVLLNVSSLCASSDTTTPLVLRCIELLASASANVPHLRSTVAGAVKQHSAILTSGPMLDVLYVPLRRSQQWIDAASVLWQHSRARQVDDDVSIRAFFAAGVWELALREATFVRARRPDPVAVDEVVAEGLLKEHLFGAAERWRQYCNNATVETLPLDCRPRASSCATPPLPGVVHTQPLQSGCDISTLDSTCRIMTSYCGDPNQWRKGLELYELFAAREPFSWTVAWIARCCAFRVAPHSAEAALTILERFASLSSSDMPGEVTGGIPRFSLEAALRSRSAVAWELQEGLGRASAATLEVLLPLLRWDAAMAMLCRYRTVAVPPTLSMDVWRRMIDARTPRAGEGRESGYWIVVQLMAHRKRQRRSSTPSISQRNENREVVLLFDPRPTRSSIRPDSIDLRKGSSGCVSVTNGRHGVPFFSWKSEGPEATTELELSWERAVALLTCQPLCNGLLAPWASLGAGGCPPEVLCQLMRFSSRDVPCTSARVDECIRAACSQRHWRTAVAMVVAVAEQRRLLPGADALVTVVEEVFHDADAIAAVVRTLKHHLPQEVVRTVLRGVAERGSDIGATSSWQAALDVLGRVLLAGFHIVPRGILERIAEAAPGAAIRAAVSLFDTAVSTSRGGCEPVVLDSGAISRLVASAERLGLRPRVCLISVGPGDRETVIGSPGSGRANTSWDAIELLSRKRLWPLWQVALRIALPSTTTFLPSTSHSTEPIPPNSASHRSRVRCTNHAFLLALRGTTDLDVLLAFVDRCGVRVSDCKRLSRRQRNVVVEQVPGRERSALSPGSLALFACVAAASGHWQVALNSLHSWFSFGGRERHSAVPPCVRLAKLCIVTAQFSRTETSNCDPVVRELLAAQCKAVRLPPQAVPPLARELFGSCEQQRSGELPISAVSLYMSQARGPQRTLW